MINKSMTMKHRKGNGEKVFLFVSVLNSMIVYNDITQSKENNTP